MSDTITRSEIAKKLGVSGTGLRSIIKWGDDSAMPKPLNQALFIVRPGPDPYLYNRKDMEAWLASNPLERYKTKTQITAPEVRKPVGLDLVNAKKFLTGQFDSRRQQRATMARKMAARQAAPVRRVVTVNTDYWEDVDDDD